MPSGYTAAIKDGITFSDFAMNCARAFGALISMRDEPLDAPIPERVEPTDYHAEKIKKAEERLSALIAMTAKELDAEAAEYWERETAYNKKAHEEAEELRKKYKAMAELIIKKNQYKINENLYSPKIQCPSNFKKCPCLNYE